VRDVQAEEAFARALVGTGLEAKAIAGSVVFSGADTGSVPSLNGIVMGKVVDAKTKVPLAGAKVSLDDVRKFVVTGRDGTFHLVGVPAGNHVVHVRLIGYGKMSKSAIVADGETVMMDVALSASVNALEQVVVTGTVVPTELKAVPNAITVITGKELEQRGITHIDQLFHGDVPGVWARNLGSTGTQPGKVQMLSRGSTTMDTFGATTKAIKTYLDGIELSDPSYLGLIDPKSIDRIEIIPGPQASTIYGANAINGVMQVFTKRGSTPRPQLTLGLSSGLIQNNFSPAMTPQHDYSGQLSGTDAQTSYNVGGSWTYMGPWTPAVHQMATSVFGGARFGADHLSVDVSLRRTFASNRQTGNPNQVRTARAEDGLYRPNLLNSSRASSTNWSNAQTLGFEVTYTPVPWWSQKVTVGSDATDARQTVPELSYVFPSDTLMSFSQSIDTRTSVKYTSTIRVPLRADMQVIVTTGADGWHDVVNNVSWEGNNFRRNFNSVIIQTPSYAHGGFLQGQFALKDAFFLIYGLRADWNKSYGKDANPNIVPRYGFAYTRDIGPVTTKLRGSFGHATKIPDANQATGLSQCQRSPDLCDAWRRGFGRDVYDILPNPDLVPQQQQGPEGGVELYFGTRASLVVTHYNQTVDNQIVQVGFDSVVSVIPGKLFYDNRLCDTCKVVWYERKFVNAGSVRNQGWSAEGSWNAGPLTFRGTYSFIKSRVIGITPQWQALLTGGFYPGQFVKGGAFFDVPEHTMAGSVQFARGGTTVVLNIHGQGQFMTQSVSLEGQDAINFRLNRDRPLIIETDAQVDAFRTQRPGYALADLNASHQLSVHTEGFVHIMNVTNSYDKDGAPLSVTIGRTSQAGVRVRW
jgi:outer membrane cobalamin receptor